MTDILGSCEDGRRSMGLLLPMDGGDGTSTDLIILEVDLWIVLRDYDALMPTHHKEYLHIPAGSPSPPDWSKLNWKQALRLIGGSEEDERETEQGLASCEGTEGQSVEDSRSDGGGEGVEEGEDLFGDEEAGRHTRGSKTMVSTYENAQAEDGAGAGMYVDDKEGGDTLKAATAASAATLSNLFRRPPAAHGEAFQPSVSSATPQDESAPSTDVPSHDSKTTSQDPQKATTTGPSRLSSLFHGWSDPIPIPKVTAAASHSQQSSLPSTPVTTRRGKTLSVSGPIFAVEASVAESEAVETDSGDDAEWSLFLVSG